VAAQLGEHRRVRLGGRDRDAATVEKAGRLAGAGADLERGAHRPACVAEDRLGHVVGVAQPELLVCLRHAPEGQRTTRHEVILSPNLIAEQGNSWSYDIDVSYAFR
jgi:hypothetical protein